mmetsp:Transcript_26753/g.100592  ORF Transcript_26753/g.100592 Transcript_26753/m.100592 type:complete len:334 (-) Transcript_26753:651-1652(-)
MTTSGLAPGTCAPGRAPKGSVGSDPAGEGTASAARPAWARLRAAGASLDVPAAEDLPPMAAMESLARDRWRRDAPLGRVMPATPVVALARCLAPLPRRRPWILPLPCLLRPSAGEWTGAMTGTATTPAKGRSTTRARRNIPGSARATRSMNVAPGAASDAASAAPAAAAAEAAAVGGSKNPLGSLAACDLESRAVATERASWRPSEGVLAAMVDPKPESSRRVTASLPPAASATARSAAATVCTSQECPSRSLTDARSVSVGLNTRCRNSSHPSDRPDGSGGERPSTAIWQRRRLYSTPWNGSRPDSSLIIVHPRDHTSLFADTCPSNASGGM